MQYTVTTPDRDTLEVSFNGQLCSTFDRDIRDLVMDALAHDAKHIVFHLDQVSFIDSIGMGLMLYALKHFTEQQKTLVLSKPSPKVAQIFQVVKFYDIFTIEDGVTGKTSKIAVA